MQVALPIVITLIIAVVAQNRNFDMLGKRIESMDSSLNTRLDDMRDVLRAEMKADRAEMAKNHSELLAKFADMENRLDRRIEKLETGKWKA